MNNAHEILVIGLGQIGYHNAQYIRSLGFKVDGYDIDKRATQRSLDDEVISRQATNFHNYDYYLVCISTHNPENIYTPFLNGLFSIAKRLAVEGKTDALVGIESTIPLGTCNKVLEVLDHRLHVAHLPHRFYQNEKDEHGVRQTRVLGGCDDCCLDIATNFYGNLLDIPLHIINMVEYAELSKIVENSYRYLEIAFAEELYIGCEYLNIDFHKLREAVNSKWNVEILEAREGIGGHCLPKDTQMYLELMQDSLKDSILESAKNTDRAYREHLKEKNLLTKDELLTSSVHLV